MSLVLVASDVIMFMENSSFDPAIKGKYIISSITLLIMTFMLWVGKTIWNDFEFEDVSILLYRLFGTYLKITAVSFVLLIIALIFGVLCSRAELD